MKTAITLASAQLGLNLNYARRYTAATFLANEHVPVRIDYQYKIMHDKFLIIDGETLES